MKRALVAIILVAALPAQAEETWKRVRNGDLNNVLVAERLRYEDGTTQSFAEDGSSRFANPTSRRGYWKIKDDEFCDSWPPADGWTCYRVDESGDGKRLRLTGDDGSVRVGTYMSR